jgi:TRAP-type mannitol/chloroaromatic compound transport system permease small subunit
MTERVINFVAEAMGRIGWVLLLYCMIFGVTDVFLRYVLNSPSLWISTTVQFAMVLMACVGGVYALNSDSFVKLDLFYANFSPRKKAICDIITVIYTFLFLSVLIWKGTTAAMLSIKLNQMTPTSIPMPLYPLKAFIPISAVVMLLVVMRKLVNDVIILKSGGKKKARTGGV